MSNQPFAVRWRWLRALAALVIALASLLQIAPVMAAGPVSLTTLGTPYTQNFDALPTSGSATWTNNSTIPGWFHARTGTGTTIVADAGTSNAGNLYSYGTGTATDRALGSIGSGNAAAGNFFWGVRLANDTGATITSLDISYTGEQWRNSAAAAQTIAFSYLVGSPTVTGSLAEFQSAGVAVLALNFTSPVTGGTAGALDGNAAANRTAISATITGLSIPNGTEIMLRWSDPDHSGSDHGLSIDDFSVTATSTPTPTNPSGIGGANPSTVTAGNATLLTVAVTPGANPTSTGLTVSCDLTSIGGSANQAFFDDATNGDVTAGDNTFSFQATVAPATIAGAKSLPAMISDAQSRSGSASIALTVQDAPLAPGSVVISEVYGGGGNAGATYKNDFIELYNRTASPISLAGWSVQYSSAAGSTWQVTTLTGSIAPGKYYLVQESQGAGGTLNLPTPDATGGILMSATAGKVALVNSTSALSGTCPTGANISDFVGYGTTANCFEGSGPTPPPSNTTSVLRAGNGAIDTNNNAADFSAGAPDPRNSVDPAPTVSSTTPANNAVGVSFDANVSITFNEAVNVSGSWFEINCASSGVHTAAVSGGSTTFTLDPDVDYTTNELCTVKIFAAQVTDQDSDDPPDNMAADYVFSFTTFEVLACGSPDKFIHEIQGSGAQSPLPNGTIVTIEGVVVGDYQGSDQFGGFYIQEEDADADADPATSEGIFVFNSSFPVNVGDKVSVKGSVFEFASSGTLLTELTTVRGGGMCSSGNSVTSASVTLPVINLNDWERYEGMLINIVQDLTATENFTLGRFGEVSLSVNGRLRNPTNVTTPGDAANALQDLNNRSRILLDDGNGLQNIDPTIHPIGGLSASNTLRSGYTVHGLTGVLEQRFGVYRVQPVGPVSFDASTNPRTPAPDPVGGNLKVAALNVLNFFTTLDTGSPICGPTGGLDCRGANSAFEFDRQRAKIINSILAINPDIAGLMEVQNDANATIQNLVDGLNAVAGAGTYAYINTGTIGTDAIKVAIIYKLAIVTPVGSYAILDSNVNPLFIDTKNRPTLAQTFTRIANGAKLTVVVNHLKTKGSDCNDVGDPDTGDGQGNCNLTRTKAAQALVSWLATDPTGSGDPDFLVVGDMNSYAKEDPITTIKNAGYTNLLETLIGAGAYSYVFDGQSGYLDHALASASLFAQTSGVAEWHNNADEPTVLDYNVEFKTANQVNTFYTSDPYRASDHDPVVVGLNLNDPPTVDAGGPYNVNEGGSITVAATGSDPNTGETLTYAWDLDNNGSFETPGQSATFSAATLDGPSSHTIKVRVTDNGNLIAVDEATVNVQNVAPVATTDSATTEEDVAVTIAVLSNDSDVAGDPLSISSVTQGAKGTVTTNANGTVTYTPQSNANGADSFTYTISDGDGGTATATVNITITPVNDPPVAVNDLATTRRNTAVLIDVLNNDFDVDNDSLSITAVTKGANGNVTIVNGKLRYGPKSGFTGTDTFTYTISDGHGGTATATVTVTVTK
jgi:predicted extracellular nuclease